MIATFFYISIFIENNSSLNLKKEKKKKEKKEKN